MRSDLELGYKARQKGFQLVKTQDGYSLIPIVRNAAALNCADEVMRFLTGDPKPPKPKVERVRLR